MNNIFELASRMKIRFTELGGQLSVEDLWDIHLPGLDTIAKSLNKKLKETEEESFIATTVKTDKETLVKFELVKHVITVKLAEAEKARNAADRRQKRQEILGHLAKKEGEEMAGKSKEDLLKDLEELDNED